MDMSNDSTRNKFYEFLEFNNLINKKRKRSVISQSETSKEIIENSTTANNAGLFQSQDVKKQN